MVHNSQTWIYMDIKIDENALMHQNALIWEWRLNESIRNFNNSNSYNNDHQCIKCHFFLPILTYICVFRIVFHHELCQNQLVTNFRFHHTSFSKGTIIKIVQKFGVRYLVLFNAMSASKAIFMAKKNQLQKYKYHINTIKLSKQTQVILKKIINIW